MGGGWGLGGVAKQDLVRGREEGGGDEIEVGVVLLSDISHQIQCHHTGPLPATNAELVRLVLK